MTNSEPAPGWKGGFAQSNPAFSYPDPDLSSLPMLDNMANIDKLERQMVVRWPQFSWQSIPGEESSRCYQMFAPQISIIGYTAEGRVYSIICPQQGIASPLLGALNVEVTVTGQRGWVDEDAHGGPESATNTTIYADMTVEGKIWFSPARGLASVVFYLMSTLFDQRDLPMPDRKSNAIRVKTFNPASDNSDDQIFSVRGGLCDSFKIPAFARHDDEAWDVANVEVKIGKHFQTGCTLVDDFNAMVMEAFNLGSGNLLAPGNTLSWNVWFTAPQTVDRCAWFTHAERWRKSIDADHGSPFGPGTDARYYDGRKFSALESIAQQEFDKLIAFLKKHLDEVIALGEKEWNALKHFIEEEFDKIGELGEKELKALLDLIESGARR